MSKNIMPSRIFLLLLSTALLAPSVSFGDIKNPDSKQATETVEIVAQGIGIDADSALRNAYSNAIQQALGLYVDAETLVRNDQIVKDQVLTHSRGLIKAVETVSEGNDNGLFNVTIRAQVLRQPLMDRVKPILTTTVAIDGRSLHAEIATEKKQTQDVQALLDKAIKPLLGPSLFNFEFDGQPTLDEKDKNKLIVRVKLTPNLELYNKLQKEFIVLLEQIATDKEQYTHTMKEGDRLRLSGITSQRSPQIIVNTWKSANRLQSKWTRYFVPASCRPNIFRIKAEVNILDGDGELLAIGQLRFEEKDENGWEVDINASAFKSSSERKDICVFSPDILFSGMLVQKLSVAVPISIDQSILARMKDMKLEVNYEEVKK